MEDVKNGKIAPYALAKISLLTFSKTITTPASALAKSTVDYAK